MIMTEDREQETQMSAGEQLKHLREQKNFSVQEIASRLKLEVRIIEAIENNDFEQLPAAIYARGYLRSYAKILDVDPEAMLSVYNSDAPEPPEIIPEVKHSTQSSSSDKPMRAFTYLISLTMVILLVAWLYSNFIIDKMNPADNSSDLTDVESSQGLSYTYPVIEHSSSPYYRAIDSMEDESGVNELSENEALVNDSVAKQSASEENIEELIGISGEASADIATDPETNIETRNEQSYPLVERSDNEGPDSITLRLTEDSWIEVFDALENKVFVGLGHDGQVIYLKGTAPFSMLLGFAEGVSVEFNGERFDILPYTKRSVAQFNLGE